MTNPQSYLEEYGDAQEDDHDGLEGLTDIEGVAHLVGVGGQQGEIHQAQTFLVCWDLGGCWGTSYNLGIALEVGHLLKVAGVRIHVTGVRIPAPRVLLVQRRHC